MSLTTSLQVYVVAPDSPLASHFCPYFVGMLAEAGEALFEYSNGRYSLYPTLAGEDSHTDTTRRPAFFVFVGESDLARAIAANIRETSGSEARLKFEEQSVSKNWRLRANFLRGTPEIATYEMTPGWFHELAAEHRRDRGPMQGPRLRRHSDMTPILCKMMWFVSGGIPDSEHLWWTTEASSIRPFVAEVLNAEPEVYSRNPGTAVVRSRVAKCRRALLRGSFGAMDMQHAEFARICDEADLLLRHEAGMAAVDAYTKGFGSVMEHLELLEAQRWYSELDPLLTTVAFLEAARCVKARELLLAPRLEERHPALYDKASYDSSW
ncbi:MAG: hypothetical protein IPK81_08535 [Rhodospirillales bacterium]|nr:MAG: hypothetical protein IPK81_08535 [Rhodospirillales bacterium]